MIGELQGGFEMSEQITLEEALKLVAFEKVDGKWQVSGVSSDVLGCVEGNVRGHVRGSITGSVFGHIFRDVLGHVHGDVHGDVEGSVRYVGTVHGSVLGDVAGSVEGHVYGDVVGRVLGSIKGLRHYTVNGGVPLGTKAKPNAELEEEYQLSLQSQAGAQLEEAACSIADWTWNRGVEPRRVENE